MLKASTLTSWTMRLSREFPQCGGLVRVLMSSLGLGGLNRLFVGLILAALCLGSGNGKREDLTGHVARTKELKSLMAAIQAAGLGDALRAEGPFTLFAPTDEAFAALPAGTIESLLQPQNKEELIRILTYHIVPGRLTAMEVGNITEPQMARTLNGQRLAVEVSAGEFRVGSAKTLGRETACGNGLVYLIDKVLLPEELRTEEAIKRAAKTAEPASLLDALRAVPDGRFSTFLAAVEASGGDQDWAQPEPIGNWTMFIPTNAAFGRLSEAERTSLLAPQNREALRELLDWHALPVLQPWSFEFEDGQRGAVMVSRQNDRFVLDVLSSGLVFVYQLRSAELPRDSEAPFKARILAGDIQVGGCLVNVVDRLIVPKQLEAKLLSSQAYREQDVAQMNSGADIRDNALTAIRDQVQRAAQLNPEAEMAVYQMGLQMLEEVLPVNRNGVIMDMADLKNPAVARQKLLSRIDDLDRVWYGNFMNNSPAGKALADPLAEFFSLTRSATPVRALSNASGKVEKSALAENLSPPQTGKNQPRVATQAVAVPPATDLSWCEVLEEKVDEKVVTDPAFQSAITATGLPWRVRDKASGIEMLLVPPGQFLMGGSADDEEVQTNELPAHSVTLSKPFYLGRYEVTREQWSRVMQDISPSQAERQSDELVRGVRDGNSIVIRVSGEFQEQNGNILQSEANTERNNDVGIMSNLVPSDSRADNDDDAAPQTPVLAGWKQTNDFCQKTGLRLPSEAEWEFACRGGVVGPRYGKLEQIAWHRGNAAGKDYPVGKKAANPLGFHDMLGNAWEWVGDWYAEYTRIPKIDPTGPAIGNSRIIRGGYFDFEAGFCRAPLRYRIDSPEKGSQFGFRVARNP